MAYNLTSLDISTKPSTFPFLNQQCAAAFTKPPLLQESRLTGGGSPNLLVLLEWKVPVERFMGAANCFH